MSVVDASRAVNGHEVIGRHGEASGQVNLAAIYRAHGTAMYNVARMVVGPTAAEDVTQDVLVDLWHRPERFDAARGSLPTYLLTVAHHRAVETVRSETARFARQHRIDSDRAMQARNPEHALIAVGDAEAVKVALNRLAPRVRDAIVHAYFAGLTYREVAVVLGESEGTVKSRIRVGLTQLRSILQGVEFGCVAGSTRGSVSERRLPHDEDVHRSVGVHGSPRSSVNH